MTAGTIVWLTGLPSSGKSTLAERVLEELVACGQRRVVILDGRVLSKRGWRITDALPGVKYRKVEVELGKKE